MCTNCKCKSPNLTQQYKDILTEVVAACDNARYCFRHVGEFSDSVKNIIARRMKKIHNGKKPKSPITKPYIVNFYGGPGTGKSTMAARIFSELKTRGLCAELICEYAKDLTWQKSQHVLNNQIYIFGKQQHRLWRVRDQVDIIVTDSPLLTSMVYNTGDNKSEALDALVIEEYNKYTNIDIFLQRVKEYEPRGRNQTLKEATSLDEKTLTVLSTVHTDSTTGGFARFPGSIDSVDDIVSYILDMWKK